MYIFYVKYLHVCEDFWIQLKQMTVENEIYVKYRKVSKKKNIFVSVESLQKDKLLKLISWYFISKQKKHQK